ncbi:bifunctional NUDIX hydrolase/histidine phosphatase family protein [Demequina sp. NBRC 110054]|uniref:NUDIX hydrolase n=1 Tax=Demequina sp. NBRC 110054 TaxID=1570343 RepID=UPI001356651F|nr:bifunctional NUDIX hydrolase/histidine phosphatase family protein [Demequina sp. NBRC 110054]
MRRYPPGTVVAAGALVWRIHDDELEVLAVHRPRYNDWSWPKGKLDPGETLPACAIREIAEETGKQVVLGQPLPSLRYPIAGDKTKVVKYWAARVVSKDAHSVKARPPVPPVDKTEIDRTAWLTIDEAHERITFTDDLRPLAALVTAYENDRLDTHAFIIARHARAKRRKAWDGPDLKRPITKRGAERARQLVSLFAAFGASRITSSPAERTMATVRPFAEASGLTIKTHDELTEPGHAERPIKTAHLLKKLLDKDVARVVCVHRPTLPTIIEMVRAARRWYTLGALPRSNPYLPAGGVIVAHLQSTESGAQVVAVETHGLQVPL